MPHIHGSAYVLISLAATMPAAADEPLPPNALQRLTIRKPLPGQGVRALTYSPDGKILAFAARDGSIGLLRGDGEPDDFFVNDSGTVSALAFTSDGRGLIASGINGGRYWPDVKMNGVTKNIPASYVNAVAISPDNRLAASGTDDNYVHVFDLKEQSELHKLTGHKGYVTAVAFAPSGKLLATGSHDRTIRFWDLKSGKQLKELTGHKNQVSALVFLPDGKTMASASWDSSVRLWDVESGKELKTLRGHEHSIMSLSRSGDGKLLATASLDGTARIWDVAAGKELRRIDVNPDGVWSVALTPDGKTLATGDENGQVALWSTATGKRLEGGQGGPRQSEKDTVYCVAYSPDGKHVASGHGNGGVYLWDLATGKERRIGRQHDYVWSVAFSPDGKHLASAGRRDGAVHIWDIATGKRVQMLTGPNGGISRILYTRDGSQIIAAGGSFDPAIFIFDLRTGKQIQRLEGHSDYIDAIALHPDGKTLASAARDNTLRLWDLKAGKELRQIPSNGRAVRLAFSPDGSTLAWGDEQSDVYLWNLAADKQQTSVKVGGGSVICLEYSRSGRTLFAGTPAYLDLFETATAANRHALANGEGNADNCGALAPNNRSIVTSDGSGHIMVWDATRMRADLGPLAELSDDDCSRLWARLAESDANWAYSAIWRLSVAPGKAVPLIRRGLTPVGPPAPPQLARWVADLEAKKFADRDRAMRELEKAGELAEESLRAALKKELSFDAHRRVEQLLNRLTETPSPDRLRTLRAVEVLENSGAPQARELLEELAKGAPELLVTREAKAALGRWPGAKP